MADHLSQVNKNVRDFYIALNLDYLSLISLCSTAKLYRMICMNEDFWKAKIFKDFKIMVKPENYTWKQYYKYVFTLSLTKIYYTIPPHDLAIFEYEYVNDTNLLLYIRLPIYPMVKGIENILVEYGVEINFHIIGHIDNKTFVARLDVPIDMENSFEIVRAIDKYLTDKSSSKIYDDFLDDDSSDD